MESNLLEDSRIHQALEEFSETLSSVDKIETEPFDGVFEVEGMEQPLVVPTNITLGELTEIIRNTEIKRQRLAELADWLDQHTNGDPQLAAELLGLEKQRRENMAKVKVPVSWRYRMTESALNFPTRVSKESPSDGEMLPKRCISFSYDKLNGQRKTGMCPPACRKWRWRPTKTSCFISIRISVVKSVECRMRSRG